MLIASVTKWRRKAELRTSSTASNLSRLVGDHGAASGIEIA